VPHLRMKLEVESWKLEVGILGKYSKGRETPLQQEVCVIAYSLLFSGVA